MTRIMQENGPGWTGNRFMTVCCAAFGCVAQFLCALSSGAEPARTPENILQSPSTELKLMLVPAGTFAIGSPAGEAEREENETQHQVTLTKPFYLGEHEVTQGEFTRVMGFNPSTVKGSDRLPVETVSWFDAITFCNHLSKQDGLEAAYEISNIKMDGVHVAGADVSPIPKSTGYRLPTEAEWEFACRAGTTTPFSFGNTVTSDQANFDGLTPYNGAAKGVFRNRPLEVDALPANAFGFRQMSGNVFEWCWDYYASFSAAHQIDPTGPDHGSERVRRGGAYSSPGGHMRSAVRHDVPPHAMLFNTGFRVARSAGQL